METKQEFQKNIEKELELKFKISENEFYIQYLKVLSQFLDLIK